MYGYDILCGISKGTFEIPHKISYLYIERYHFYTKLRTIRFKSSQVFLKHPPALGMVFMHNRHDHAVALQAKWHYPETWISNHIPG